MATAAQKRQVIRWVNRWRERLLLAHWTVDVTLHEVPCWEFDPKEHPEARCRRRPHQAEVEANHRYSRMKVAIFPHFWTFPADERQRTLIHEMWHSVTDRVRDLLYAALPTKRITQREIDDAIENLTEHSTSVVWLAHTRRRKA